MPANSKPKFSFVPVARALKAEARRAERDGRDFDGRLSDGPLWDVKVTAVVAGDYHRSVTA